MDLKVIRYILEDIEKNKKDFECAHWQEDYLYIIFIEHVAEQGGELGEMAKEVLKSRDIDFKRDFG